MRAWATLLFIASQIWGIAATTALGEGRAVPIFPSFEAVLTGALSQSLEAKRVSILRDQAVGARDLLGYENLPQIGTSATWGGRRPEAGSGAAPRYQTYGAHLSYDLYDFGRREAKRLQADQEARVRGLNIEEVNETLTWRVARTYLSFVSSARLLAISAENMKVSEARFAATRKGYSEGLRPENDLVAAEADFGDAKLSYDKAEADLLLQTRAVELLMGKVSASAPMAPLGALRSPEDWENVVRSWGESALSAAGVRRSAERESLVADEKLVSAVTRPTLGVRVGADRNGSWLDGEEVYSGQLELSWDLTWPGQTRVEREQIGQRRLVIDVEDAIEHRERSDTTVLASERFRSAKRLWAASEAQLRLRSRQYDLVRGRYEVGKATVLELSSVELELGRTRLERERVGNLLAEAVLDLAEAKRIRKPATIFADATPPAGK